MPSAITSNVYSAAHFALELDQKKDVGLFRSVEGGGVKADVMTYAFGANKDAGYGRWKILGKPKFEDIKLQIGMAMSQSFYDWIQQFFTGQAVRKNGAIIAADFYYKERARRTFSNAMIKELTFPKLDGADKNPVYMGVTLAIEDMAFARGDGSRLEVPKGFNSQKIWTACNFDFRLDDYKDACNRVTKVDSFTIKQNIIEHHVGGFKAPIKTPSPIEFPIITFYVPEVDATPFMDHAARRVGFGGKGNGEVRPATAMNGTLQTYDNEMKPIFDLKFFGADIISCTPDKQDAGSEELKQCKVEMFSERIEFFYPVMELE